MFNRMYFSDRPAYIVEITRAIYCVADGYSKEHQSLIREVHAFLEKEAQINFGVLRGDKIVSSHILKSALGPLAVPPTDDELRQLVHQYLATADLQV